MTYPDIFPALDNRVSEAGESLLIQLRHKKQVPITWKITSSLLFSNKIINFIIFIGWNLKLFKNAPSLRRKTASSRAQGNYIIVYKKLFMESKEITKQKICWDHQEVFWNFVISAFTQVGIHYTNVY